MMLFAHAWPAMITPILARGYGMGLRGGRSRSSEHPVSTGGLICMGLAGWLLYAFHAEWQSPQGWRKAEFAIKVIILCAAAFGLLGFAILVAGLMMGK